MRSTFHSYFHEIKIPFQKLFQIVAAVQTVHKLTIGEEDIRLGGSLPLLPLVCILERLRNNRFDDKSLFFLKLFAIVALLAPLVYRGDVADLN